MIEKPGTQTIQTVRSGPNIVVTTVIGVLVLAAIAGAAVALFNVALTTVTIAAFVIAIVAFVVLWPAIMLGLRAGRSKVEETVARALPIETLIAKRGDMEKLITQKGQQLANARGYLNDFKRVIDESRGQLPEADISNWQQELEASNAAFSQAQTYYATMQDDLREFDLVIKKARIDMRLAEARGNLAGALQMARLSPTEQHTTEAALSEISRRSGRTAELLDAALTTQAANQQRRIGGTALPDLSANLEGVNVGNERK
ncbi:hypothetical protein [Deinococcus detaillensis]|uniref:hypothetical protein n=1 Tax=Deinococcus detaillensis TaxID=2592048 RepID=UPI00163D696C|nr:hypothetical protein [Deinococcus detaillensis]